LGADEKPVAARPEPQRVVASAQTALAKLGYGPLKPDGVMGPGTKQAVERFEKDRKLPVTGTLAGKTVRKLASDSGVPLQ
jgi:peptidoglycan hydrolase-like protein with peptidoglycan-binding domain